MYPLFVDEDDVQQYYNLQMMDLLNCVLLHVKQHSTHVQQHYVGLKRTKYEHLHENNRVRILVLL